ncbi:SEC-C metal-binding domain-containing protein [Acinetobacter sp. LF10]|uniref:SEC-C metal-binding domain-containing protein n=1 Tax=Acinetobacter sp. LF10 TaxID=3403576 RepID=UPI003B21DD42
MKTEKDIFKELEKLAEEEGFLEILAFLAFKDTYIIVQGEILDSKAFIQSYDKTKLSKTELSTLIALTFKNYKGNNLLTPLMFSERISQIYKLFEELHYTFLPKNLSKDEILNGNFLSSSSMMREAIFYSAESAFKHQYRDISKIRYQPDDGWLKSNKGFSIEDLVKTVSIIEEIQLEKANNLLINSNGNYIESFLSIFQFEINEIINKSKLSEKVVKSCISALLSHPNDKELFNFNSVDDFNHTNAFPIIKINNLYYNFSIQTIWESIYESPFFWFNNTKYADKASKNRGIFTEYFTANRLETVFNRENVFTNIDIFRGGDKAGEIDILITFGKLALIIQAKSKKLTIAARKGNSAQLAKDFKNAVQEAYDQALNCSQLIQTPEVILKDEYGKTINISRKYETILPICVVSDHYPALATQARQFLRYHTDHIIKTPFVTDVFFIDTLAEMLPSPLHIFDYLIKRTDYGSSIILNHELSTLAVYINQNLYFQNEFQSVMLDDNVTCDLELAMMARRDHLENIPIIPDGLLTRFKNSYIGKLIDQVCNSDSYKLQQIGFHLLSLDEKTINFVNEAIEKMIAQFHIDLHHHDLTVPISESYSGITIHCNVDTYNSAYNRLKKHIERRKYSQKAKSWVGFIINPYTLNISIAIYENYEWQYSKDLEKDFRGMNLNNTRHLINIGNPITFKPEQSRTFKNIQPKIGRNEKCPCGSGLKFKKCCDLVN